MLTRAYHWSPDPTPKAGEKAVSKATPHLAPVCTLQRARFAIGQTMVTKLVEWPNILRASVTNLKETPMW